MRLKKYSALLVIIVCCLFPVIDIDAAEESGQETLVISDAKLETVILTDAENVFEGVKIKWKKYISKAQGYYIERKTKDTDWEQIDKIPSGDSKGMYTEYIDKTAVPGVLYTYRMKPFCQGYVSDYSNEIEAMNLIYPRNIDGKNQTDGILVEWYALDSMETAEGYYIYRKERGGEWENLAKVSDGRTENYLDTTVESGKSYSYIVKAYSGEFISYYFDDVPEIRRLETPEITVKNLSSGIQILWDKVKGTEGYYVQRKSSEKGSWKTIKTIKNSSTLKYTDSGRTNGSTYYYRVIAYYGSVKSQASLTETMKRLSRPTVTVKKSSSKLNVSWKKNSKCSGYEVYCATDSSFTKNLKTITCTSKSTVKKSISGLKKGKYYYVKVRSYYKTTNGKYYSAWSTSKKIKL